MTVIAVPYLFCSSDFTVCMWQEECSAESTANDVGFTAQGTAKPWGEKQHPFAAIAERVARTCQVSEAVPGLQ